MSLLLSFMQQSNYSVNQKCSFFEPISLIAKNHFHLIQNLEQEFIHLFYLTLISFKEEVEIDPDCHQESAEILFSTFSVFICCFPNNDWIQLLDIFLSGYFLAIFPPEKDFSKILDLVNSVFQSRTQSEFQSFILNRKEIGIILQSMMIKAKYHFSYEN